MVKTAKQRPEATDVRSDRGINWSANALEKVIEIAKKRRGILSEMRAAIQSGDKDLVFQLAKKLTGISDETSNRVDQGLH
jgi:hypothetical protein